MKSNNEHDKLEPSHAEACHSAARRVIEEFDRLSYPLICTDEAEMLMTEGALGTLRWVAGHVCNREDNNPLDFPSMIKDGTLDS